MSKKRKSKKRKVKKSSKKISRSYFKFISIFIVIIVSIFMFFSGYNYIKKLFFKKNSETKKEKKVVLDRDIVAKMNKMLKVERKKVDILKKELEKSKKSDKSKKVVIKKNSKKGANNKKSIYSSEYVDYKKSIQNQKVKVTKKELNSLKVISYKPLLAIIIDDVAFRSEVKKIKELPFKVTPSFFPPTKRHPDTPKYAKEFTFYMVHLPLQAMNYPHPEPDTLQITSSQVEIDKRLKKIKQWFPRDRFINNHTGSKFTSNYSAMKRLYKGLKKYQLIFVDSRTSTDTKAPLVAKEFHQKLLSRDIFLDNIADINYIKNQLKKAVKIAKKRGYAIAIGHPHPKTLLALKNSKDILMGVKPVYLRAIYENSTPVTR